MKKSTIISAAVVLAIIAIPIALDLQRTSAQTTSSATYSVSVDYSKPISQLLTSAGISQVDDNITLGLFNSTSQSSATLTVKCVRQGDFIPPTDYAGKVTGSVGDPSGKAYLTMPEYYGYMHAKGYRPLTLQETLNLVKQYPSAINCQYSSPGGYTNSSQTNSNNIIAYGSAVETPDNVSKTSVTIGSITYQIPLRTKTFAPVISKDKETTSIKATTKAIATYTSERQMFDMQMGVLIVTDSSAAVTTVKPVAQLATQAAAVDSSGRYVMLTGDRYPVSVNYDSASNPSVVIKAKDVPASWDGISGTTNVNSNYSGTRNINVVFAVIRDPSYTSDAKYSSYTNTDLYITGATARQTIQKWAQFSGYRFATARELVALNSQYPNQFPMVLGLGSYNNDCPGWPILYPTREGGVRFSAPTSPIDFNTFFRTYFGNYKVAYTDLKFLDRRGLTGWYASGVSGETSINSWFARNGQKENAFNINEVRFALVPISQ